MQEEIIRRGVNTIQTLRQENQILRAQVDTFNSCMDLLRAQLPCYNQAAEVDVAWEMKKVADQIESDRTAKTPPLTPLEKAGIRP